jgi:WD40 repeat protein
VAVFSSKKERRDFDDLSIVQSISKHSGTIWSMKFSHDGARLASGGQDAILRVWRVAISSSDDDLTGRMENGEKVILEPEPEQSYQVCVAKTKCCHHRYLVDD